MTEKNKVTSSPFAGYCIHCNLVLCALDMEAMGHRCPRCNKLTNVEESSNETNRTD